VLNDYFALLNEPRRPWLDPELVQARFLALSAPHHPDHVHTGTPEQKSAANDRFAALNAAWLCLRDPKQRLRHLLELERGEKIEALEALPDSASADVYFQIGRACREADRFLNESAQAASPLMRAERFQRRLDWTERLKAFQQTLTVRREALESALKNLNSQWEAAPVGATERRQVLPLDQLEQIYRDLSYLLRWTGQIGERLLRLASP
jgi:curved DNA-binding protein CbpA